MVRKKRVENCPRGQTVRSTVKSLNNNFDIKNALQNSGFDKVSNIEYVHSHNFQINEAIISLENDNRPFVKVSVFKTPLVGLLDSGAHLSILGIGALKLIRKCSLKVFPSDTTLRTANGEALEVTGLVYLPITFNGATKMIDTLVVPSLKRRILLGMNFWKAFEIRPTVGPTQVEEVVVDADNDLDDHAVLTDSDTYLSEEQLASLDKVKSLFKIATDGILDTTNWISHRIELTEEAKKLAPARINPFPTSPKKQEQINAELDKMLQCGIIEKSYSDWALRLVPVDKSDGTVRLCLDARKLNERTIRDSYPLPHSDRILSRLGKANFITTLDLSKAFLQVPLHPRSRKYTAFSVLGRGLFQFTRMPFGLVNSPATLSRLMDRVLGSGELEPNVFVYLDDIIVISETFEEHLTILHDVASRLRAANLSINLDKSHFCVPEVTYLGYILGRTGLSPNPDRVAAIVNYERPTSLRSLRRFLGMCNYYRRFLANYSAYTQPLTDLLKNKPKSVNWNDKAEASFNKIKELLISAPILTNPDFTLHSPFIAMPVTPQLLVCLRKRMMGLKNQ